MVSVKAIRHTTQTLCNLLEQGMETTTLKVTVNRPGEGTDGKNRINLFLFRVEENNFLKNEDQSRLWLDLYYLLTPYDDDEKQVHTLLGDAMRVLHDNPIIRPDLKLKNKQILADELKDAVERIKITPSPMTLEEMSKIWTPLKGDFRLSVAYHVSVIQIDSVDKKTYHPPVRATHIESVLASYPEITEIRPPRASVGETLKIFGRSLRSEETRVNIGGKKCSPTTITNEKIEVEIPSDLLPGPQPVQVESKLATTKDEWFRSNQDFFTLLPMIRDIKVKGTGQNKKVVIEGTNLCDPRKPPQLETTLLIGHKSVEIEESDCPTEVTVKRKKLTEIEPELPEKLCLLRIRINEVESKGELSDDYRNEWMWFYDKTQPTLDVKITKLRFPEEVLERG